MVVLDHLSEAQRRVYIIADNKLAQNAGWDDATLAAELADLEAEGLDLALVGFSDEELRELMSKDDQPEAAAESGEDEVPEAPVNPVTRLGDVWVIGPHKLVCGDCRDLAVVSTTARARMNGTSVTTSNPGSNGVRTGSKTGPTAHVGVLQGPTGVQIAIAKSLEFSKGMSGSD